MRYLRVLIISNVIFLCYGMKMVEDIFQYWKIKEFLIDVLGIVIDFFLSYRYNNRFLIMKFRFRIRRVWIDGYCLFFGLILNSILLLYWFRIYYVFQGSLKFTSFLSIFKYWNYFVFSFVQEFLILNLRFGFI